MVVLPAMDSGIMNKY